MRGLVEINYRSNPQISSELALLLVGIQVKLIDNMEAMQILFDLAPQPQCRESIKIAN